MTNGHGAREDKNGKFRWYNEYSLPEGGTVVVRLDTTVTDIKRKLNRAENLRQIPPSDAEFKWLHKRRNDIESTNRAFDAACGVSERTVKVRNACS